MNTADAVKTQVQKSGLQGHSYGGWDTKIQLELTAAVAALFKYESINIMWYQTHFSLYTEFFRDNRWSM